MAASPTTDLPQLHARTPTRHYYRACCCPLLAAPRPPLQPPQQQSASSVVTSAVQVLGSRGRRAASALETMTEELKASEAHAHEAAEAAEAARAEHERELQAARAHLAEVELKEQRAKQQVSASRHRDPHAPLLTRPPRRYHHGVPISAPTGLPRASALRRPRLTSHRAHAFVRRHVSPRRNLRLISHRYPTDLWLIFHVSRRDPAGRSWRRRPSKWRRWRRSPRRPSRSASAAATRRSTAAPHRSLHCSR